MSVLLLPLGSAGDAYPFVGLGRALSRRGHRVKVATHQNFRGLVERAGLSFASLGTREELAEALGEVGFWHPRTGYRLALERLILPAMRRQFELIAELAKQEDLVVVASTSGIGARIAHDKLGVPLVTVHIPPMVLWSEHLSPVLPPLRLSEGVPRVLKRLQYRIADRLTIQRWAFSQVNAFRRELGLGRLRRTFDLWNSPLRIVGLFPEWFAPRQPDWPEQFVQTDFPVWDDSELEQPSPALDEYLAAGDPPIVFTLSSTRWRAREFFHAASATCARLGRRGLLLAARPEDLPESLPPGVRAWDYVPFRRLLAHSVALVHHGGVGTAAQALAAGIPQVVRPVVFDQPDNAARLQRLGVSETIGAWSIDAELLTRAIERLLSSARVRDRCAEIAAWLRPDPAMEQACEAIESVGRRGRPDRPQRNGR